MFASCSEVSTSAAVKHVQHTGFIRTFCLPGGTCYVFQFLGEHEIAGLWFVRGISTQAYTMLLLLLSLYTLVKKDWL